MALQITRAARPHAAGIRSPRSDSIDPNPRGKSRDSGRSRSHFRFFFPSFFSWSVSA